MKYLPVPTRRPTILASGLVASILASVPTAAKAQELPTYPAPRASAAPVTTYTPMLPAAPPLPSPPPVPPVPNLLPPPALTPVQLAAMADLFSAPSEEVMQRLRLDPGLAALALAAAQHEKERERKGKVMTGLGWTMVGVGLTAAVASFISPGFSISCGDGCQTTENRMEGADKVRAVALVSVALGLGIAIPGMVVLGKTSDIENQAIRRYQRLAPGAR